MKWFTRLRVLTVTDRRRRRLEVRVTAVWLVVTAGFSGTAWHLTKVLAAVSQYDDPYVYSIAFLPSQAGARKTDRDRYPLLKVVPSMSRARDGATQVQIVFQGDGAGPGARLILGEPAGSQHKEMSCGVLYVNGNGWKEITASRFGLDRDHVYFDLPDSGDWTLTCLMFDRISRPNFTQRSIGFENSGDTVGDDLPQGAFISPIEIKMDYYELMSDSHFVLTRKALDGEAMGAERAAAGQERINTKSLSLQPGERAIFEWISTSQEGKEITWLVVVGALIAIAAATFIEAVRFWLLAMVGPREENERHE